MTTTATLLDLGAVALPVASDRRITEQLSPIGESGDARRTVNGRLVSLADPAFRKFRLSVSGDDLYPPALDGAWKGMQITVAPSTEMIKSAMGVSTITLDRTPVSGSVIARTHDGAPVEIIDIVGRTIYLGGYAGVVYLRYRPLLDMMLLDWSVDSDEAAATVSWSMELEEV